MKVFCILSDGRAFKSKSPAMHTAVMKRYGIDGIYVPFAVEADLVGDAVRGIRALSIEGANVTVPYKETVIPYLDRLSEEASEIGAVNTIVRRGSELVGYNTDSGGFCDALKAVGFDLQGKPVMVLGTGGAAKALLHAVFRAKPGRVTLIGRNPDHAARLGAKFGCATMGLDDLRRTGESAALLVNATSASSPEEAPQLAELIRGFRLDGCELVVDLNYGRNQNFWQDMAKAVGASFMDGLPMLAHQARRSFELWTGIAADAGEFLRLLL
ncbi:MAG: shikimate dehydrogenase [Thermodesulfobacteriota bacterium]